VSIGKAELGAQIAGFSGVNMETQLCGVLIGVSKDRYNTHAFSGASRRATTSERYS
jgi:hypothetical protein